MNTYRVSINTFQYSLRHEDFVFRETELLSSEGDVADAVGLLHLAGGQTAFVVDAADVKRLTVFGLSSGERSRGYVRAICAHPVVGPTDQNLLNRNHIIKYRSALKYPTNILCSAVIKLT